MNESPLAPVPVPAWRPLAGFGPLFGWGLFRVVRWRKVVLVALTAVLLGGWIGFEVRGTEDPALNLSALLDGAVLGFGLPLIALLLAAEGFAREVSSRTLVYLLVRPVRRSTIFLARFLAGFVPSALVGFLFLASVVLLSGVPLPATAWASLLATASLAALALGAVFFTLGALFRHGLVAGLIYAFAVETFLSSVPGSMQQLSVMFHVRSFHYAMMAGALPDVREESTQTMLFSRLLRTQDTPPEQAVVVLLAIAAVVLAIGAWRVTKRDWAL